ncbi:WD40-repeat-containing domain protein [Kalaharituber pfeilii]|nr:WD40-repeat-containing domain protein [Kalaharituber pfeilii]
MAVSPSPQHQHPDDEDDGPAMLDPNEAAEEIPQDEDEIMHSDSEGEEPIEVELVNDAAVYFDGHTDSIFSIAQHPKWPGRILLTGGGDDVAYIWEISEENEGEGVKPRAGRMLKKLYGHSDSVVAAGFSEPDGQYVVTGGLDGKLRLWENKMTSGGANPGLGDWEFVDEVKEVEEINWIEFHPKRAMLALGAVDGSVWVYSLENGKLENLHALYNHGASCTAGAWTPEGGILCTVSQDGSFYAWQDGKAVVSLGKKDARFAVERGLVSVAVNWDGTVAVVGGLTGTCKVVGLPRPSTVPPVPNGHEAPGRQAGQVLATMEAHSKSVESLSFSRSLPLLASGSVDGSIVIYDTSRGYTVRRTIPNAHPNPRPLPPEEGKAEGEDVVSAVVKAEFINSTHPPTGIILTSCGIDGTLKRWDARSGQEIGVWKGHGDGILGFVQTDRRVVTAGDDHVALVFDMPPAAVTRVHAVQGAAVTGAATAAGTHPPNTR